MKTMEEKAAIRVFAERHPHIGIIATRLLGPTSHGFQSVWMTIRLPSGIMGHFAQEVKL